ncbi:capsular polysaccharide biosynthesis protein [Acinetobacter sp.]|uniref:capsular polysaccharide biosynthesis protein n=1 Tax=Acinetobacter sp. TaxID=472 RepID=UPI003BAF590B
MYINANKNILSIVNLYKYIFNNQTNLRVSCGWGRKKSFFKAQSLAEKKGLKALCLEDGFIRSLGLGKDGYAPLSLVVDETGIYFDALQPSDLEQLILQPENQELNLRATSAIQTILQHKITKYNQRFCTIDSGKFDQNTQHILVIDQTFGDQSIKYAGATPETFKIMLAQACLDHPEATIWVKTHPDVLAGKAQSHFQPQDLASVNIQILTEAYNPIELLGYIDEVYVVSSQLGFEALLCGKKVHCFGVPWYAGWGLTDDQYAPLEILNGRRGVKRSLNHLFASAYFHYARYVNPVTGERCECEDIIDLIIPNIEFQKRLGQSYIAYGFSPWKKKFIADFLSFPKLSLKFQRYLKPKKNQPTLAWGKKAQRLKDQNYLNVITVEDGFIRSVGLGATLIRPCSLVFDDVGIYYDATKPSGIENLLNQVNLTEQQLQRARDLQQKLIDLNISKYNVGESKFLTRPNASKVILVVGQVEDDMSIQLGGVGIKTNLDLLKQVRENHPESYIIYKPHPDVQTGLRIGKISEQDMSRYADQVELDTSILECFEICDEVHTITSLSGFEALIRGLKVYCYGLPFYAGWGLTQDLYSSQRRNNKNVSLETLLYVTLVEYPTYNLPYTQASGIPLVRPEDVIAYIKSQLDQPVGHNHKYKHVLLYLYNKLKK